MKHILIIIALVLMIGAGASARDINEGATIYIGETHLNLIFEKGDSSIIGWWPSAKLIASTTPTKTVDLAGRYTDFTVSSGEFTGYTGPWYRIDPKTGLGIVPPAGSTFVFYVRNPITPTPTPTPAPTSTPTPTPTPDYDAKIAAMEAQIKELAKTTPVPTTVVTIVPTVVPTVSTVPTTETAVTIVPTPIPAATVNHSATIALLEEQIAQQNIKIEEQSSWIDMILKFLGLK